MQFSTRILYVILIATLAMPAIGADTYTLSPMRLLEERVDEHDETLKELRQEIDDLKKQVVEKTEEPKVEAAEAFTPTPAPVATPLPRVVHSQPTQFTPSCVVSRATYTSYAPAHSSFVVSQPAVYQQPVIQQSQLAGPFSQSVVQRASGRRLRTVGEIRSALRAKWTNRTYATMQRGQSGLVKRHLTSEHGYAASQVNGLSHSEAMMLHNLAHVSSLKISPYTTGQTVVYQPAMAQQPVAMPAEFFNPTPTAPRPSPPPATTPSSGGGNCENGQCFRGGSRATSGRFLGRLFGR